MSKDKVFHKNTVFTKKGMAITVDRRWYRNYGQFMGSGARRIAIIIIKKIKRSFFTENII